VAIGFPFHSQAALSAARPETMELTRQSLAIDPTWLSG
jgi:hypothetical protein